MTVLLLVICGVLTVTAGGLWTLMRGIRRETQKQFGIDKCMRAHARDLVGTLRQIDTLNLAIQAARATAAATVEVPPAYAAARAALMTAYGLQEIERLKFTAAFPHCPKGSALTIPKQSPQWYRLAPDSIGPQTLETRGPPRSITVQAKWGERYARFVLTPPNADDSTTEDPNENSKWSVRWAIPIRTLPLRTSTH